MASQEQATTTTNPNPSAGSQPALSGSVATASVASNLTQPSVSTQSNNSQPQLTASNLMSAVHLQQLQKQASQMSGHTAVASVAAPSLGYGYATLPAGYALAAPQFAGQYAGLTAAAAYDPKSMLASANKLKMLPTPTGIKLEQRYAPY